MSVRELLPTLWALAPLVVLLALGLWRPAWFGEPVAPRTWNGPVREHEAVDANNSAEER